jgi:hypothetical protein
VALVRLCSTMIHPREIQFPSVSEAGVVHTVISATILNDSICTCRGWNFRSTCSHQQAIDDNMCDYVAGPSTQFTQEIIECPKCGAPLEDYELNAEYT